VAGGLSRWRQSGWIGRVARAVGSGRNAAE